MPGTSRCCSGRPCDGAAGDRIRTRCSSGRRSGDPDRPSLRQALVLPRVRSLRRAPRARRAGAGRHLPRPGAHRSRSPRAGRVGGADGDGAPAGRLAAVRRGRRGPARRASPVSRSDWRRAGRRREQADGRHTRTPGRAAQPCAGLEVAATDRAILRVLANQAAVALHNSFLFHATTQLRGRSDQLYDATTRHARDLAARSAELAETQRQLVAAMQRQALDDERHRIARELHDSVTQSVLSIGMTIEVCRAELESMGGPASQIAERLVPARDLSRHAAAQLRAAIYALHRTDDETAGPLPVMLQRLSTVHRPTNLHVKVVLEGQPGPLPPEIEQSILRWTGEALFNAAAHGKATRAQVRLHYRADAVALSVSDNGTGDPAQLRRALRLSRAEDLSGRHRGLANMLAMTEELGGILSIRRSRSDGILLRMVIPRPPLGRSDADSRPVAEGCGGDA